VRALLWVLSSEHVSFVFDLERFLFADQWSI
jgi:hypothetical protein